MCIGMQGGKRDYDAYMTRFIRDDERLAGMRRRTTGHACQKQPFFNMAAMTYARDDLLSGITALAETETAQGIEIEIQREEFT
jgi:hypothetical protein